MKSHALNAKLRVIDPNVAYGKIICINGYNE